MIAMAPAASPGDASLSARVSCPAHVGNAAGARRACACPAASAGIWPLRTASTAVAHPQRSAASSIEGDFDTPGKGAVPSRTPRNDAREAPSEPRLRQPTIGQRRLGCATPPCDSRTPLVRRPDGSELLTPGRRPFVALRFRLRCRQTAGQEPGGRPPGRSATRDRSAALFDDRFHSATPERASRSCCSS